MANRQHTSEHLWAKISPSKNLRNDVTDKSPE